MLPHDAAAETFRTDAGLHSPLLCRRLCLSLESVLMFSLQTYHKVQLVSTGPLINHPKAVKVQTNSSDVLKWHNLPSHSRRNHHRCFWCQY